MKKIYMIWEDDWGNTGIFFDNEKDAKEYCALLNNGHVIGSCGHYRYSYKIFKSFNTMQDFKTEKKADYKNYLKDAIKALKESINEVKRNRYYFNVNFGDSYYADFSLEHFENVLNNFKEDYYSASQPSYETYIGYHYGKNRCLTKEDLPIIKEAYKKAKLELKNMQKTLKQYQKEYVELCGKTNNPKEEKELTK